MDRYAASGTKGAVTDTPGESALYVSNATGVVRARIHFFALSAGGTPADNTINWLVRRAFDPGTGGGLTPRPLDENAPISNLTAIEELTGEPTYYATLFDMNVHQRSLYQWNATPQGELQVATIGGSILGIGFTPIHASYGGPATANAHWQE